MRRGSRGVILEAARRVIQDHGVTGLTFDAVARESGITRPGVMYHFPARDQLLLATHRHLAAVFEERLAAELPVPYGESSVRDRLLAYVRACAEVTSRAELLFMLEAAADPAAAEIWSGINGRWLPPASDMRGGAEGVRRFIVRLAADGLWLYEASTGESLTPAERREAAGALADLLHGGGGGASDGAGGSGAR